MNIKPKTDTPEQKATSVVQRISPEQWQALERGEAICTLVRRAPITIVDFYPGRSTTAQGEIHG